MKPTVEYLTDRHQYWKERIGMYGIWEKSKFNDIKIRIKTVSRTRHAAFCRKYKNIDGGVQYIDTIILYNNTEDYTIAQLDNFLVHEMIHQYIAQSSLQDNAPHGKIFRFLMGEINKSFPNELNIKISEKNLNSLDKTGHKVHTLLIISQGSTNYCCVIHPSKVNYFERELKKNHCKWQIDSYCWAFSNHNHFLKLRRCMKTLHGFKIKDVDLNEFYIKYNIQIKPKTSIKHTLFSRLKHHLGIP